MGHETELLAITFLQSLAENNPVMGEPAMALLGDELGPAVAGVALFAVEQLGAVNDRTLSEELQVWRERMLAHELRD